MKHIHEKVSMFRAFLYDESYKLDIHHVSVYGLFPGRLHDHTVIFGISHPITIHTIHTAPFLTDLEFLWCRIYQWLRRVYRTCSQM